ncbi:MAG: EFR1 family ferrodoxin, partial [Clostridia bacterium]|nr:EFR1 family ferrodoxin [Clostridia bacterium]
VYFGFPVYACNPPAIVMEFISQLPEDLKGQLWYVFSTQAIYSGNAIANFASKLKSHHAQLFGYSSISLPGTDGLAFLDKSSAMVKKIKNTDYSLRLKKIDFSPSNEPHWPKRSAGGIILGGLFMLLYKPLERAFKKKFYADDRCTGCKKCEKQCPVQNIRVTGNHVAFSDRCILCMRCIHQCPSEAIQIGRKTVDKFRWKGFDAK